MMDLQAMMGMMQAQNQGQQAPEMGSRTAPLNSMPAQPAGMDKNALLQMLLQMLMQSMGQGQQGAMPMQGATIPQQSMPMQPPSQY